MATTTGKSTENASDTDTPVTDTARKYARDALETATEKASGLERKLRSESGRLGDKVDVTRREASEQFDQTLAGVEDYIRKEPVKAAGIAFAAGIVAALVMRR